MQLTLAPGIFTTSMRRIRRVIFVVFYIWATVTVSSERTSRVVDRFQHRGALETIQLHSPCQHSSEELPNFGHAEKSTRNVVDVSREFFHTPQLAIRQFEKLPQVEYFSLHDIEVHSSRAPPALS